MPPKRALWTEDALQHALDAVNNGMPVLAASKTYDIPRRTLRNHINTGSIQRKLGRRSLLDKCQENELCNRIFRLAEVGMPLTSKLLRRTVFTFAEENRLKHNFSQEKRLAGRKWMNLFYKRHPEVARRKSQTLNPARAQKLNRFIVNDYFQKLKQVLIDLNLANQPQRIFNIDEKGCCLILHHQQQVLTRRGTKRVYTVAPEHAENVTVVACGNALGQAIPSMILFKGKRQRPEWLDATPPGTSIEMTSKGSMTPTFIKWLDHFGKYKPADRCLLLFDGASSHLDGNIVTAAEAHNVTLLCLPSNTTHELQALDKSVFRSFEHFWDEKVLQYWVNQPERKISKARLERILSFVWPKTMSPSNLRSGFKATGIYPYNPDVISEAAFLPSTLTENAVKDVSHVTTRDSSESSDSGTSDLTNKEIQKESPCGVPMENKKKTRSSSLNHHDSTDSDEEPLAQIKKRLLRMKNESSKSCLTRSLESSLESPALDSYMIDEPSCSTTQQNNSKTEVTSETSSSFTDLLPTPEIKIANVPRRPAINSRAQVVTTDLFKTQISKIKPLATSTPEKHKIKPEKRNHDCNKCSKKNKVETSSEIQQSWYCFLCERDSVLDMRKCGVCQIYVHEECAGLSKNDKEAFVCPCCSP